MKTFLEDGSLKEGPTTGTEVVDGIEGGRVVSDVLAKFPAKLNKSLTSV